VHFVDEGVDTGPIIAQAAVAIQDDDTQETLHERIKVEERRLLVEWVSKLLRRGYTVEGRTVRLGKAG
jgi:phosphoribosylglycinamide formyltransferase-1